MRICWIWSLLIIFLTGVTQAQQEEAAPARGPRILQIEGNSAAAVLNIAQRQDIDAVSLDLMAGELQAHDGAREALLKWVAGGGIVLLHTDIARWFGYSTLPARLPTDDVAGQLYGRSVAALPLGAHPLLWDGAKAGNRTATESPGVHLVYYQMNETDHLVTEHPSAVPLLRVTDLAVANDVPLYAAAMAPYGQGWAIFTPTFIEQERADGALFIENLMQWLSATASMRSAPPTTGGTPSTAATPRDASQWYSLPATFVEGASDTIGQNEGRVNATATLQELYRAFQPGQSTLPPAMPDVVPDNAQGAAEEEAPVEGEAIAAVLDAPRLLLQREELTALAALLNSGIATEPAEATASARTRASALLYLLRARLELQRGLQESAGEWIEQARELTPAGAEVLVWQGVLWAGAAENITLSSQERAELLAQAVEAWSAALNAPRLTGAVVAQDGLIGSVPVSLVQAWIVSSQRRAQLMAVEPPLVSLMGNPANPVVIRHFPQDATLRLALPAGDLLPRASAAAGWRATEEEILIFPSLQYYQTYRAASGLGAPAISDPTGAGGDVAGHRIFLISQPALPILLPSPTPGGQPRVVQFGTAVPVIISRLHAYVLMDQIMRDGNPPPAWMQIGLVTLANLTVTSNAGLGAVNSELLRRHAQAGGLLLPEQFRAELARATPGGVAEAQAARLLAFFYDRYGAGRVVETLQRLGAGETVDEALVSTTGLTEEEFFLAWRQAEFG